MKKILKSVKINSELLEIIDEYTTLMKSISGGAATFTTMVDGGIVMYLQRQIEMLGWLMDSKITMENGVLKELAVTDEQKRGIDNLKDRLFAYGIENGIDGVVLGTKGFKE